MTATPFRCALVAILAVLVGATAGCSESDDELFDDVGATRIFFVDSGLRPQSLIAPELGAQVVEWDVEAATVETSSAFVDLVHGEECLAIHATPNIPVARGDCTEGVVIESGADLRVRLILEMRLMRIRRAEPVVLGRGGDYDADGVPDDGDGSGSAFDGACGLGGAGSLCDDNCPLVFNPDQEDSDGNGIGDACSAFDGGLGAVDRDSDADGIVDRLDNCVWVPNPGQEDEGEVSFGIIQGKLPDDGIGDACPEQVAWVALPDRLDLGPEDLALPLGSFSFLTVDFDSQTTLDCDWGEGTCTLDPAEVRFCPTTSPFEATVGCF